MADIEDDNLYPLDGEWFAQPEQRVLEEADDKRKIQAVKPILKKLLKSREEWIAYYRDVDNIPVSLESDPAVHQQFAYAHKKMRAILQSDKEYIEGLISQAK